jgi:hypothetical protein
MEATHGRRSQKTRNGRTSPRESSGTQGHNAGDAARKAALKQRVRPSVRAEARKAAVSQRPLPTPPRRPVVARRPAAAAAPELTAQINSVQDKFERLAAQAELEDVFSAVGDIDNKLTQLPFDLEALRDRGYVHSGQLEDRLEALDNQWDEVRPRVEKALTEQVQRLDTDLDQAERQMSRLTNANAAVVKSVDTAVDTLGSRVTAARGAVQGCTKALIRSCTKSSFRWARCKKCWTWSPVLRRFACKRLRGRCWRCLLNGSKMAKMALRVSLPHRPALAV